MALEDVIEGIQDALEEIPGLTVYREPPESLRELPCAMTGLSEGQYDQAMGGLMTHKPVITVFVSIAAGFAEAQQALRTYIAKTGTYSIKAAIDTDHTLGGTVDHARVTRYYDYGGHVYNETAYLGCRFELEIYEA